MPQKLGLSGKKRGNSRNVQITAGTIATLKKAGAETPAYVYDLDAIESEAVALRETFGGHAHGIFYAVKANGAGSIVRALASRGLGADVVTGAELLLALACGVAPEAVVYSGVAKTDEELSLAIGAGDRGIRAIQVESLEEIARVDARARAQGRVARIAIRVNPGLDFEELATHAHVATGHDEAKFGIATADLGEALAAIGAAKNVSLSGISSHVGSQFFRTAPYVAAARIACELAASVRQRFPLEFVDTGGGFGVDYTGAECARPATAKTSYSRNHGNTRYGTSRFRTAKCRGDGSASNLTHSKPNRCARTLPHANDNVSLSSQLQTSSSS